jgi:hypothetical protein
MNEADKIIFKGFKVKSLSKGKALFFRSSVLYGGSQVKRNRKLVFPWFLKIFKSDKYFKLIETIKPSEIMLAYKNRNSFSIYPTELANINFALLLTFNSAPILSGLNILPNAFLGRRSYNNVIIAVKI